MRERGGTATGRTTADGLPQPLVVDLERAGYYPQLVTDVLLTALAGEEVTASLVHLETTFDTDEVRRHVTVLATTGSSLLVAHVDDHGPADGGAPVAAASTESVPLAQVRSVVLSQVLAHPERYVRGQAPSEVTLTVGWGSVSRVDVEPATCGDPECDADHGYTGTVSGDDVQLRVSAAAEGEDAVRTAVDFARVLTAATRSTGAATR